MNQLGPRELEFTASEIVDSAVKIHSELGPGLLESAYQACLAHELERRGHNVLTEVMLPLNFEGLRIEKAYKVDMMINNRVIVENKVVQSLLPVHKAQIYTYLKLSEVKLGLLINWNNRLIKQGIKRVVYKI